MVFAVRDQMQEAYPELKESAERVSKTVETEETRFAHTLDIGLQRLEDDLDQAYTDRLVELRRSGIPADHTAAEYSGEKAFKLYDTFGLPLDFMVDAVRDRGMLFDQAGFDRAMEEQRERARASWKGAAKQTASPAYSQLAEGADPYEGQDGVLPSAHEKYNLRFVGYEGLVHKTRVVAVFWVSPTGVDHSRSGTFPGEHLWRVVLEETPFYATAGGQEGDRGWLLSEDGNQVLGEVVGSDMPIVGLRVITVKAMAPFAAGETVIAKVDRELRQATMRHHTGTHLLHAALRNVLGTHVKQAGSLVDPMHLRFDFSHFAAVEDEELQDIEDIANREVLRNDRVESSRTCPSTPPSTSTRRWRCSARSTANRCG